MSVYGYETAALSAAFWTGLFLLFEVLSCLPMHLVNVILDLLILRSSADILVCALRYIRLCAELWKAHRNWVYWASPASFLPCPRCAALSFSQCQDLCLPCCLSSIISTFCSFFCLTGRPIERGIDFPLPQIHYAILLQHYDASFGFEATVSYAIGTVSLHLKFSNSCPLSGRPWLDRRALAGGGCPRGRWAKLKLASLSPQRSANVDVCGETL